VDIVNVCIDLIEFWLTFLCCSPYAYMTMAMNDHFHFVYFGDQCEMLPKFYKLYDDRLLCVNEL